MVHYIIPIVRIKKYASVVELHVEFVPAGRGGSFADCRDHNWKSRRGTVS